MIRIHDMLGYMYSKAVTCFLSNNNIPAEGIQLIASRADSIPPPVTAGMQLFSLTGKPNPAPKSWTTVLAAETSITTAAVTGRPIDEHGPTRASPVDSLLLQHPTKFRVCVTINELLAITIIPPADSEPRIPPPSSICGPGTMFIDYAMRYATSNRVYNDYNGTYASIGTVNHNVVDRTLKANDYSTRVPPLHIATEMFGHHEAQAVIDECLFLSMTDHDTVATITRITAENIVRQYHRLIAKYSLPDEKVHEIFFCGPGAHNTDIIDYVEEMLPTEVITRPLDDIGIPGDAKEAVCCAHLGLETILKFAVREDGPFEAAQQGPGMGTVVKGKHWDTVQDHLLKFSGGGVVPPVQRVLVEKK